jgi:hypothetical protein
MLNANRVLNYIKTNIGFPFQFIEKTDEEILDYVKTYSLREFSQYFPDVVTIGYNPNIESNKVPGRSNEYYIVDEQGLEILGVSNVYFPQGDYLLHGHPPLGPLSLGELASWVLSVEVSMWVKQFSSYDRTFEFKPPNILRISSSPTSTDFFAIEYERVHPPDFSKVRSDLEHYFLDLALADIMIVIGRARKRYAGGNLRTPFGEIPLDGDILEEGKEKKREVLEKLQAGPLLNVLIDIG